MSTETVNSLSRGLSVIRSVMDELHILIRDYNIKISKNTIVNVTEIIKEVYTENITEFRVLTSEVGFLITDIINPPKFSEDVYNKSSYLLSIFSDNNISRLEQIGLSDMLGLFGVDLTKFTYLSKCTFHFNKLYRVEQLDMIPSIEYKYETNGSPE